jgi:MFS family permease
MLAVPLVAVVALGATELEVGLLTASTTTAFLLIGLPVGAWVDRSRHRTVLVTTDLARAAILATVPLAWWAGVLTIWQLYAVALLSGACSVFMDVAQQSYLPRLVGRDNLLEANTKLHGVRAVAQIGGPGVAGPIVQVLTAPFALVVNVVMLCLSALAVGTIRAIEEKPARQPGANLLREVAEGIRFVLGHRMLRAIAACNATFNFAWAGFGAMLIVFLARELDLRASLIGVFFMFAGAGSVTGLLLSRRTVSVLGQGPTIWMAPAFSSPFLLVLPITEPGLTVWIGACAYLLVSVGQVIYNVTQVSFRQRLTPERLLGRMSATMRFLVWGTMPLGALAGGVLGQVWGVRNSLWILGGIGSLAFLPLLLSPMRSMRELPAASEEGPPPPSQPQVPAART